MVGQPLRFARKLQLLGRDRQCGQRAGSRPRPLVHDPVGARDGVPTGFLPMQEGQILHDSPGQETSYQTQNQHYQRHRRTYLVSTIHPGLVLQYLTSVNPSVEVTLRFGQAKQSPELRRGRPYASINSFLQRAGHLESTVRTTLSKLSPAGTAESAESSPGRKSWVNKRSARSPVRDDENVPGRKSWAASQPSLRSVCHSKVGAGKNCG